MLCYSCQLRAIFLLILKRGWSHSINIHTSATVSLVFMRGLNRVCFFGYTLLQWGRRKSPLINSSGLQWASPFVLMPLSKEASEPFMWASLNILSLKTALLFPLTSAKRVSDLCALLVLPQLFADEGGSD